MKTIPEATLILTVLLDGHVHMAYFDNTPTGRVRAKSGQVVTIAPWEHVLRIMSLDPTIRVVVRFEPAPAPPDYVVSGGGSIFLVHSKNDSAFEWLSDHVSDEASWLGQALAVEHRYIGDLIDSLRNDGLEVR